MSDTPVGKEDFPNIHSKLPLAQLETFFSCPLTYYLRGETDPCLTTTFFQVVEYTSTSEEVTLYSPAIDISVSFSP